jgi:uncharacterized protein YbjT (DUF2867 family)
MRVLVVGATGVLGRGTVRCLRAGGHDVRGMTRSEARARDLAARGAEPVIGDLTDPPSLDRACAGAVAVFAAAHGALGRGKYRSEAVDDTGHRALIDAARRAGVARFVYTSALGAAPDHPVDFFRTKWAIEQYLAASGMSYVVLRPTAFMEWHAHVFNGKALLDKGRTMILGTGTKKRNFVAARDVAAVAAQALTGELPRDRIVAVGGPSELSNDEVAQLYASAAGIPARTSHLPRGVTAVVAAIAGPLHPGVARIMRLSSLPDDACPETLDRADPAVPQVIGATSLESFVRERVLEHRAAG